MITSNITFNIPTIQENTSPGVRVEIMMDAQCFELPVKKNKQFIGSVTLEECTKSIDKTIENIVSTGFLCIHHQMHLFDKSCHVTRRAQISRYFIQLSSQLGEHYYVDFCTIMLT